jgi:UDP-glucose 4-epimerase
MSSQPAEPVPDGQDKQAQAAPRRTRRHSAAGLTVAVTGPTGAIGRSVIRALESDTRVDRILGMARRPLDPATLGWHKTEYRQGDVLDRHVVEEFVADADVVIHLAFAIMGSRDQSRKINLTGSRNVFEATVAADRPYRLIHTSSLAAYGYHADNPVPLTEDVPPRGSPEHYYSAHKAECEAVLAEVTAGHDIEVYVLRPCVVVGPDSDLVISVLRFEPVFDLLPGPARDLFSRLPLLRPVLPDPGVPIQLVHEEDVGTAALAAAVGAGPPGAYNLAGDGEIRISDVASAMGMYSVPVPGILVGATSRLVAALPFLPSQAEWIHAIRCPMLMDTTRAHRELGWMPKYSTRAALDMMARAVAR